MTSQKVVTQFAAGNLFTGRYLQTEMTGLKGDGILGWGRPFTSRPIALTGWIRYNSGKVNYADSHIGNNEQDQGYIFIALGDWQEETYTYKVTHILGNGLLLLKYRNCLIILRKIKEQ